MARRGKSRKVLPDVLMPEIMKRVGENQSMPNIQLWLKSSHGIQISQHAIASRMRKIRRERAPLTRAVIEQKIGATVAADVDRIEELLAEAKTIATKTRDPEIKLKAIETQRRLLDMRFGLNGAGDRETPSTDKTPHVNVNVAAMPGGQAVVLLPPEEPQ